MGHVSSPSELAPGIVIRNKSYFISNFDIHDINTRYNYNLHLPSTNLTLVQKGVHSRIVVLFVLIGDLLWLYDIIAYNIYFYSL
jgi:hypothetical protein